jgi:hypothetical protein
MKNALVVILTILTGLCYGWCIVKYPIMSQMIACTIGLGSIIIFAIAVYKVSHDEKKEI